MQEQPKSFRLTYTDENSTLVEEKWIVLENQISTPSRTYYRNGKWDDYGGTGNLYYFFKSDSGKSWRLRYYAPIGYDVVGECKVLEVSEHSFDACWITEFHFVSN